MFNEQIVSSFSQKLIGFFNVWDIELIKRYEHRRDTKIFRT